VCLLSYANRAKNIKNKPRINEDPKDAMLREYKSEIERLKRLLEEQSTLLQNPMRMQPATGPLQSQLQAAAAAAVFPLATAPTSEAPAATTVAPADSSTVNPNCCHRKNADGS
jgi:hypothetical protein